MNKKLVSRFEFAIGEHIDPNYSDTHFCLSDHEERKQRAENFKRKIRDLMACKTKQRR